VLFDAGSSGGADVPRDGMGHPVLRADDRLQDVPRLFARPPARPLARMNTRMKRPQAPHLSRTRSLARRHTHAHACAQVPHLSLPHARRDRSVHRRPRRHDVWRSPDYLAGALARLVCQSCSGTDNAV
jgi:hypothetical protein